MWKTVMGMVDQEDSTPIIDKVYSECTQRKSETNSRMMKEKQELFTKLFFIQHDYEFH